MSEADKIIKNLKNSGKKVEEFYVSNKTSDKNVVNDIKILNKFCEYEDAVVLTEDALEEVQDALQNILAEREQKDKRIQELEEQVKTLDEAYTGVIKESKKWFDIAHNSIPTQVVIDLIKNETIDISGFECIAVEDLEKIIGG